MLPSEHVTTNVLLFRSLPNETFWEFAMHIIIVHTVYDRIRVVIPLCGRIIVLKTDLYSKAVIISGRYYQQMNLWNILIQTIVSTYQLLISCCKIDHYIVSLSLVYEEKSQHETLGS